MKQLIFRQERIVPFDEGTILREDVHCVYCASLKSMLSHGEAVIAGFGFMGGLKCLVKLLTRKRIIAFVVSDGKMASYAWIMLGSCNHYHIEKDSAVIGPVFTQSPFRGRGLATFLLRSAINEILKSDIHVSYIDTSEDNQSMLKVIEKCCFGSPVDSYER